MTGCLALTSFLPRWTLRRRLSKAPKQEAGARHGRPRHRQPWPGRRAQGGLAAEVAGQRDTGVAPGLATVLVGSPAEAALRSLEPAHAGAVIGTCTKSVGERIIR
jgi:hypothetical protein